MFRSSFSHQPPLGRHKVGCFGEETTKNCYGYNKIANWEFSKLLVRGRWLLLRGESSWRFLGAAVECSEYVICHADLIPNSTHLDET